MTDDDFDDANAVNIIKSFTKEIFRKYIAHNGPENLKKSKAKKLVKSNKSKIFS